MAGAGRAGRRRPFPDRLAWIRRRTWSKQRGAKLRSSSSSESEGNPKPVVKAVPCDGDVASKHAMKLEDGGGDGTCSPTLGSGSHEVIPKRTIEIGGGGHGDGCDPNLGTSRDGSPKHVVAVEDGGGEDRIWKGVVGEEGASDGSSTLNLGRGDGIKRISHGSNVHGHSIGRGRLRVDCKGQLYVLDSEAEDSDVEESCRPKLRRCGGSHGRRAAATGEVAQEVGTIKGATSVVDDELTP